MAKQYTKAELANSIVPLNGLVLDSEFDGGSNIHSGRFGLQPHRIAQVLQHRSGGDRDRTAPISSLEHEIILLEMDSRVLIR